MWSRSCIWVRPAGLHDIIYSRDAENDDYWIRAGFTLWEHDSYVSPIAFPLHHLCWCFFTSYFQTENVTTQSINSALICFPIFSLYLINDWHEWQTDWTEHWIPFYRSEQKKQTNSFLKIIDFDWVQSNKMTKFLKCNKIWAEMPPFFFTNPILSNILISKWFLHPLYITFNYFSTSFLQHFVKNSKSNFTVSQWWREKLLENREETFGETKVPKWENSSPLFGQYTVHLEFHYFANA